MFESRSEFNAKIKEKTPMRLISFRDSPRGLTARTLTIVMTDKLTTNMRVINWVKASAINIKRFTKLCKDIDFNHQTLLFQKFFGVYQKLIC